MNNQIGEVGINIRKITNFIIPDDVGKIIEMENVWSKHIISKVEVPSNNRMLSQLASHFNRDDFVDMELHKVNSKWRIYDHYFILFVFEGVKYYMGFDRKGWEFRVIIKPHISEEETTQVAERRMGKELVARMRNILGMTNYSLMYRNCEHAARYLFDGVWMCSQINNLYSKMSGKLIFKEEYMDVFPGAYEFTQYDLHTGVGLKMIHKRFFREKLDKEDINIIFFGPLGAGKSNLINHLSGKKCVNSGLDPNSMTQMIEFVRCQGHKKHFNFVDTIGVDHSSDWGSIFESIKRRLGKEIPLMCAWLLIKLDERLSNDNRERIKYFHEWVKSEKQISDHRIILTHCRYSLRQRDREDIKRKILYEIKRLGIPAIRYTMMDLYCDAYKNTYARYIQKAVSPTMKRWIEELDYSIVIPTKEEDDIENLNNLPDESEFVEIKE